MGHPCALDALSASFSHGVRIVSISEWAERDLCVLLVAMTICVETDPFFPPEHPFETTS